MRRRVGPVHRSMSRWPSMIVYFHRYFFLFLIECFTPPSTHVSLSLSLSLSLSQMCSNRCAASPSPVQSSPGCSNQPSSTHTSTHICSVLLGGGARQFSRYPPCGTWATGLSCFDLKQSTKSTMVFGYIRYLLGFN